MGSTTGKTERWEGTRDNRPHVARMRRDERGEEQRGPLPLGLRVFDHSPCGFEWGYEGSGPAQLALAILLDHLGFYGAAGQERRDIAERALRLHEEFKFDVVAGLEREFILTADAVEAWIKRAVAGAEEMAS